MNINKPQHFGESLVLAIATGAHCIPAESTLQQSYQAHHDMNELDMGCAMRFIHGGVTKALMVLALSGLYVGAPHAQVPANPYSYSRTTNFAYDPTTGFVSSQTTEPGNAPSCVVTSYGYDTYGNKTTVTTSNCSGASGGALFTSRSATSSFTSPASQTITVSDNNNAASDVAVSYPQGLVSTSVTNAAGQSETRQFDPRFGSAVSLTGPNALKTTWVFDDFGRKIKETLADGTSTVLYYCVLSGLGLDTSGNTPNCPTPAAGEAPADAVAFVHSEPRDKNNTKMGAFRRVYIDRLGRSIRSVSESFDGASQPGGRSGAVVVQDTSYNVYGVKIIETQPYFLTSGSSTTAGSNNVGASLVIYDVLGRPAATYATDPNGKAGSASFGAYGTQTAAKTLYTYSGLTVTVTNDKGQTRTEEKNPIGETVRVTDASGAQLAYQHDAFGNLITTKDALQNTIALVYDIAGRKTQMNDPDAGVIGYCYDALGQLTAQQNSTMRGNNSPGACPGSPNSGATANSVSGWTTFAYDKLGRQTQRIEPEFTSTWTYDTYADNSACNKGAGKLCQVVTSNGISRKVVYDNLGRPINSVTTTGTGPSFASAVAYDANTGRVSSETYPTGLQVGYQYTARGFLEKLSLLTAATVKPLPATAGGAAGASVSLSANTVLWQAQSVNAWNATERQLYGNGVVANAAYEAATGRSTDITAGAGASTTVLNHHYSWDSLNNLIARNDANGDGGSGAVTETFTYGDNLNRLTGYSVTAPAIPGLSRSVSLQYNALGMLLYKSDVGVYTYGPQGVGTARPHALLALRGATDIANSYDANGNLISASTGKYRSISYTSFNLPDSQSGITGPNGSPKYSWVYDDSHARVKEVRTIVGGATAGTRTTWYLHPDNEGGLGFEREDNSNAGSSNRHFLSAVGQVIGVLVSTDALPSLAAGQTAPSALSSVTLAKVEYWHKDYLGSLAATTDHAGNLTARYAYDPFGKRRYANGTYDAFGNLVVDWSPAVNAGTSRGFTGHEGLDDVGLVHMNGRIFDPTLGVFLQADPHVPHPGNLQSYNRYGYCLNNPLTCTDPSGFDDFSDFDFDYFSEVPATPVVILPTVWVIGCKESCNQSSPPPTIEAPPQPDPVVQFTWQPPLPGAVAAPSLPRTPAVPAPVPSKPVAPPPPTRGPTISPDYAKQLGGVPMTAATGGFWNVAVANGAVPAVSEWFRGTLQQAKNDLEWNLGHPAETLQNALAPFAGPEAAAIGIVGKIGVATEAEIAAARAASGMEAAAKGVAGEASSLANAARLRMQLKAEEVAGARLPSEITGYSRHGLNQAISRDGVGVAPGAILDAVKNPLSITGQSGGRFMMTGKDAVVIVNDQGKVITTWATNAAGVR